ncbi:MAG: ABC transporter ATP-binding protein [Chloroflexi bacterium]|nr:ABC transporter ATP-binding protein [Chloroflexota bacterium]
MTSSTIEVVNLSKRFRIGALQSSSRTLRDMLVDAVKAPFQKRASRVENTIWALKDVSFAVSAGDVVGIIGRNGSGKSTLLKILARVTEPTSGQARLRGRVGSLLEVGTGFHLELTGRENIFLSGVIMGMRREEVKRSFDEIVAFAEMEKFIDTPVKHYSSGMYMRLAFAVAAHLRSDILLVDEVLAVGDIEFQRRCLSKMEAIGQEGRSVIFVSHDMHAIARLCSRALWLNNGQLMADGVVMETIGQYMGLGENSSAQRQWDDPATAPGNAMARLRSVRILNEAGVVSYRHDIRCPITVEFVYDILQPGKRLSPFMFCNAEDGTHLFLSTDWSNEAVNALDPSYVGRRTAWCTIPGNLLAEGRFTLSPGLSVVQENNNVQVYEPDAVSMTVYDPMQGDSTRGVFGGVYPGALRPLLNWRHEDRVEVEQR